MKKRFPNVLTRFAPPNRGGMVYFHITATGPDYSENRIGSNWILILAIAGLFGISSCRNSNDKQFAYQEEKITDLEKFQEGSVLALDPVPSNLKDWLSFYQAIEPGFQLAEFKASGVVLHIDTLPQAITRANLELFKPLLAWSPDSSHFIDIWSYGQQLVKDSLGRLHVYSGDPDQEVVLANQSSKKYLQLLYYGPSDAVESADWLGNHSFVLGLLSLNAASDAWIPEIYLFNLSDSTFTNFRLRKEIPTGLLSEKNFTDWYFMKHQILINE